MRLESRRRTGSLPSSSGHYHGPGRVVSAMLSKPTALLVAIVAVSAAGCRKTDPLVAEYSSVGSGRAGGGSTIQLFASGQCEVRGPFSGAGTYKTSDAG